MWQKHKLEEDKIYFNQIGNCRFWIKKHDKVWQIARVIDPEPSQDVVAIKIVDSLPEGIDWTYFVAAKQNTLQMLPSTPDRSLIIKPEEKFSILHGMSIEVYINIPLWIQLYASSPKPANLLLEFPVRELSSTWFGEPDNGELAYSYPGEIKYSPKLIQSYAGNSLCPITIRNESDSTLNFQRLLVPVEQLNMYSDGKGLYTNGLQVKYKGEENPSEIHISTGSPSIVDGLNLLNGARINSNKNIFKKSFSFIKSITDY